MATNVQQRNNSPSPSRNTFGSKLASIGSKLSRTFSGNESYDEERDHIAQDLPSLDSPKARSVSRGREALQSTGRGGFGNIRAPSQSRERPQDGPDDFSATRGREPVSNPTAIYSTGRGGAGNLRSPSRDASRGPTTYEKDVVQHYVAAHADAPVSVGRGGVGNINRSRSRDPAAARVSTGRGGAGNNVVLGEGGYSANVSDEAERHLHEAPVEGYHSTGRGGFANITEKEEPGLERPSISISEGSRTTGRGGAGNIQRN